MQIAKITAAQADAAARALFALKGHDEAACALLALSNDTDVAMTSDGPEDARTERLITAAPVLLHWLRGIAGRLAQHEDLSETERTELSLAFAAIADAEGRDILTRNAIRLIQEGRANAR